MPAPPLRNLFAFCLCAAAASGVFAQAPYGIHARSGPADYAVSQQNASSTFAASVAPAAEVKRLFAVDISKSYLVIEVACYPAASKSIMLSADDFLIRSGSNSEFTHPADAVTVASVIQDKNTPHPPSNRPVSAVTTAGIGYESGTDPYTGRRIHSTYTEVETAVGVGQQNPYPGPPPPGSTPYDRMTLQDQLAQRALPSGNFTSPIAGFLYFPTKEVKKKNGVYELEYLTSGAGTVRLEVPANPR